MTPFERAAATGDRPRRRRRRRRLDGRTHPPGPGVQSARGQPDEEARENVIDALRELPAAPFGSPPELPDCTDRERTRDGRGELRQRNLHVCEQPCPGRQRRPVTLSGGQRQRVAMGRAVVRRTTDETAGQESFGAQDRWKLAWLRPVVDERVVIDRSPAPIERCAGTRRARDDYDSASGRPTSPATSPIEGSR